MDGWMEKLFIHSFSLYIRQIIAVIGLIVVNLKRIRRRSLISITHIHHIVLHVCASPHLSISVECVACIPVRKSIWDVHTELGKWLLVMSFILQLVNVISTCRFFVQPHICRKKQIQLFGFVSRLVKS